MRKILIATHNKAKLKEIKLGIKLFFKKPVKALSLDNLKITIQPEETGKTFEENSKLKAKFYAELTKFPTIADDGGLIVPSLNNEPGVKSKRWLGYDATDEELINYTLKRLSRYSNENRIAYLQVCLTYYDPATKKIFFAEERIKGHIALNSSGKRIKGYPYRALFIVDEYDKYYDELTDKEHHKINHRLKALKRLLKQIV